MPVNRPIDQTLAFRGYDQQVPIEYAQQPPFPPQQQYQGSPRGSPIPGQAPVPTHRITRVYKEVFENEILWILK